MKGGVHSDLVIPHSGNPLADLTLIVGIRDVAGLGDGCGGQRLKRVRNFQASYKYLASTCPGLRIGMASVKTRSHLKMAETHTSVVAVIINIQRWGISS